jgi:hypothetical protein
VVAAFKVLYRNSPGGTEENKGTFVRFQVLTAASMMFRVVFWNILPDDGGSTHL